jgi:4-phosphopantoate--beta-alanine ligase
LLRTARHPVISVNGNTAALAASEIALLQKTSGALVEVNLFHRTPDRVRQIEALLQSAGAEVFSGEAERLLPLSHDRAWCRREGMYAADVVLVPLEDGDRCGVLVSMGKKVIAIDLNPLSRTANMATLTVVDEVTRALPVISDACSSLTNKECRNLITTFDNKVFLSEARNEMKSRLSHALD